MKVEKIYLGGGCFWGVEDFYLKKFPSQIQKTCVGYMGGNTLNPTYKDVCSGTTNHAEVVEINYQAEDMTLEKILKSFFEIHDPTTKNRQGPEIGTQYRSCIFTTSIDQKNAAIEFIDKLEQSSHFSRPIVTEVELAGELWPAEEYHQKYFIKNPHKQNCHLF